MAAADGSEETAFHKLQVKGQVLLDAFKGIRLRYFTCKTEEERTLWETQAIGYSLVYDHWSQQVRENREFWSVDQTTEIDYLRRGLIEIFVALQLRTASFKTPLLAVNPGRHDEHFVDINPKIEDVEEFFATIKESCADEGTSDNAVMAELRRQRSTLLEQHTTNVLTTHWGKKIVVEPTQLPDGLYLAQSAEANGQGLHLKGKIDLNEVILLDREILDAAFDFVPDKDTKDFSRGTFRLIPLAEEWMETTGEKGGFSIMSAPTREQVAVQTLKNAESRANDSRRRRC